jgi:hypothetical protein
MTYRVQPVRMGFLIVLDHGGGVCRVVEAREAEEDAKRLCGDLNRFAELFAQVGLVAHSKA